MTSPPTLRTRSGVSRQISFRLPNATIDELDRVAAKFRVSRNNVVAVILTEYLMERGTVVEQALQREAARGAPLNIFA